MLVALLTFSTLWHAFTSLNSSADNNLKIEDVYLVPDETTGLGKTPTLPPRNAPMSALGPDVKSATLLSVESNVYEDLDSDTDDGRSSTSAIDTIDVFSDALDETLENSVTQRGTLFWSRLG